MFLLGAEREGFEPSKGFNTLSNLAGCCIQPLCHLSLVLFLYFIVAYFKEFFNFYTTHWQDITAKTKQCYNTDTMFGFGKKQEKEPTQREIDKQHDDQLKKSGAKQSHLHTEHEYHFAVDVPAQHLHIGLFFSICVIITASALYFATQNNFFATGLFALIIAVLILEQVSKQPYRTEIIFGVDGLTLNHEKMLYIDFYAFSVVDKKEFILYKKDGGTLFIDIDPSHFDTVKSILYFLFHEKEYDMGFFEAFGKILSP